MAKKWQKFEDQVRGIASLTYNKPCEPRNLAGVDVDGVVELDPRNLVLYEITVNHTLDKVRGDITRLEGVRSALYRRGVITRCFVVLNGEPTPSMLALGAELGIDVVSVSQLASEFLYYELYVHARLTYPFGSAVDPQTGIKDTTSYVPVTYQDRNGSKQFSTADLAKRISTGTNVILLGEYGSGKSRCVSELFDILSKEWGESFQFPVAVNLRDSWGLERSDELIRRHFNRLGLDHLAPNAVRAYNRKTVMLLLDGFDEIGTSSWSSDDARLRQLRSQALIAVKDCVKNSGTGTLVSGREHYFSSDKEMFSALGMEEKNTLVVKVRDEFSLDEMLAYFNAAGIDITLPDWLPRRPLICQTIAHLSEEERDGMFGSGSNEAEFFNHFINVICSRDARINASFDANTIYEVFLQLSEITRNKSANVGPITQRELQEAFERVVGRLPVEDASVMLQRLPSLGRVGPDSGDRQFIDMYILDGLRAHHISRLVEGDELNRRLSTEISWDNALGVLGQKVLASKMGAKSGAFLELARRSAGAKNGTLSLDIVSGILRLPQAESNFSNLEVRSGSATEIDFSGSDVRNLEIKSCIIEEVVLPSAPPRDTFVSACLIGKITGASSVDGLGAWIKQNEVDEFDSVRTVRRIRDAGLNPAHEVLVAIVKKTFFQPGAGRKEEALLRGFAAGAYTKVAPRVLAILVGEDVLRTFRGDEGKVYSPNRKHAGRMKQMLDELRASSDSIWQNVGALAS